ncbi:hypothetical protein CDD83_4788 [Cordyceps sp. RAO-2017]|nr:hypothetical protein CDD83_4788 [Cordyceps sp. RAO-2017]
MQDGGDSSSLAHRKGHQALEAFPAETRSSVTQLMDTMHVYSAPFCTVVSTKTKIPQRGATWPYPRRVPIRGDVEPASSWDVDHGNHRRHGVFEQQFLAESETGEDHEKGKTIPSLS